MAIKQGLVKVDKKFCKACGLCIALCPTKVFAVSHSGKAYVTNPDKCISCYACEIHCPEFCVEVSVVGND